VDNGCTCQMTHDKELFTQLNITHISIVIIINGKLIIVEGKSIVAIESSTRTKYYIFGLNALFTPMLQKVAILAPFKKNGYFDPLTFGPLLIS